MNCLDIKENLSAYLDGEMEADKINEIEKHLENCGDCKSEYDELLEVTGILRTVPNVSLPDSFDERLRNALIEVSAMPTEETQTSQLSQSSIDEILRDAETAQNKHAKKWRSMFSVAALFVIGIFSLVMYNQMDDPDFGTATAAYDVPWGDEEEAGYMAPRAAMSYLEYDLEYYEEEYYEEDDPLAGERVDIEVIMEHGLPPREEIIVLDDGMIIINDGFDDGAFAGSAMDELPFGGAEDEDFDESAENRFTQPVGQTPHRGGGGLLAPPAIPSCDDIDCEMIEHYLELIDIEMQGYYYLISDYYVDEDGNFNFEIEIFIMVDGQSIIFDIRNFQGIDGELWRTDL